MSIHAVLRTGLAALPLLGAALSATPAPAGETPAPATPTTANAVFTDSTAAPLAASRKVAIAELVISFQASAGEIIATGGLVSDIAKHGLGGLLRHEKTTETGYMRLDLDPALAGSIADGVYQRLRADLAAEGYEVVPAEQVTASANYQALQKEAGYANPSRYYDVEGDTLLAAPAGLPPYMPYSIETGNFYENGTTYIPGWIRKIPFSGGSSTPGGPKFTLAAGAWKVPELESKLAQELGAHVLKAHYVVTLGRIDLSASHDYGDIRNGNITTTTSGTATAALGLHEAQSRIAFRTAGGKSQKAARGGKYDAAKDGDVVVTLDRHVGGLANFYRLDSHDLETVVSIADAPAFTQAAVEMIGGEQKKMLDLARPQ